MHYKIFPYQKIKSMVEYGLIKNTAIDNIQPASLDVTLDLKKPLIIEKNHTGIVPIKESFFELRDNSNIKLSYSSRSTTARNGILVNAIEKSKGEYFLEINPLHKDIVVQNGDKLGQFYFLDLTQPVQNHEINVNPLIIGNTNLLLKPNNFYLTQSYENHISIDINEVGILREYEPKLGKYFTHLNAGFFDPGFEGKPVFEVITAQEININCKQTFAIMDFIPLTEPTLKPYNGNYQHQNRKEDIIPKIDYSLTKYTKDKIYD